MAGPKVDVFFGNTNNYKLLMPVLYLFILRLFICTCLFKKIIKYFKAFTTTNILTVLYNTYKYVHVSKYIEYSIQYTIYLGTFMYAYMCQVVTGCVMP